MITSPKGTIVFMALDKPVRNKYKDREEYSLRLEFDGSETEFRKQIEEINPGLVVTSNVTKEGNYRVNASTKFQPNVLDADGNSLSDYIPSGGSGTTGTAIMVVKPFKGNKGGSINLDSVAILELETTGETNAGSGSVDALRAALKAAK